jgi:hypothetical protein
MSPKTKDSRYCRLNSLNAISAVSGSLPHRCFASLAFRFVPVVGCGIRDVSITCVGVYAFLIMRTRLRNVKTFS